MVPWLVLLVFYSGLLALVALPVGLLLALWSWSQGRRAGIPSGNRPFFAAMLPFALIVVAGVWFIGYATMSMVRGLDPMVGTSWSASVSDGYLLCMVGRADVGTLVKEKCGGVPVVQGIRALGQCGTTIVGVSNDSDWFVLETETGRLTHVGIEARALAPCRESGALKTTFQFYRDLRMGWPDAVALLVLASMLAPTAWIWHRSLVSYQHRGHLA
jgi:hypothetical protein